MRYLFTILSLISLAHAQSGFFASGRELNLAAGSPVTDTTRAKFNFSLTSLVVSGIQNVFGDPHSGSVSGTDSRTVIPITVTSTSTTAWRGINGTQQGGSNTNGSMTAFAGAGFWFNNYPANTTPFLGYIQGGSVSNVRISGCDPAKIYTVKIGSGLNAGVAGGCGTYNMSLYCIDSTNSRLDSLFYDYRANTSTLRSFINKRPDASGYILLAVYPAKGGTAGNCGQYGVMNYMEVIEQASRQ